MERKKRAPRLVLVASFLALFLSTLGQAFSSSYSTVGTVGTSTSATAIGYSYQRKSFYSPQSGRYWVFYSDGVNMIYKSSSDGQNWDAPTSTVASVSSGTFTSWSSQRKIFRAQGRYWVFYGSSGNVCFKSSADLSTWTEEYTALDEANDIYGESSFDVCANETVVAIFTLESSVYHYHFRNGTLNADGTITWDDAVLVFDGGAYDSHYPSVGKSATGVWWAASGVDTGTASYYFRIWSSADGVTWTQRYSDNTGITARYTTSFILPTSSNATVYFVFSSSSDTSGVYWVKWNGASMSGRTAHTLTNTMAASSKKNLLSACIDSNNKMHLVWIKSGGALYYKNFNGASWSSETNLDSATCSEPSVCYDSTYNVIHAFWIKSNVIYHAQYISSWGAIDAPFGTSFTSPIYLTCNRDQGFVIAAWREGSASPYSIKFGKVINAIRACSGGSLFDVFFANSSGKVHYAYSAETATTELFYRRGTPQSNGSIVWDAAEQTVGNAISGYVYYCVSVSVDSAGYPWVGCTNFTGAIAYPKAIKSSTNDGTFTREFIFQLFSSTNSTQWRVVYGPQTGQKMIVLYYIPMNMPRYRTYDTGSGFGSDTFLTTSAHVSGDASVTSRGDSVYVVYACLYTPYRIIYWNYTPGYGWQTPTPTQIYNNSISALINANTRPVISVNASGWLFCIWGYKHSTTDYHIYWTKKNPTDKWDSVPCDWIDESTDKLTSDGQVMGCFREANLGKVGVVYMTKQASPYNIRFALLDSAQPYSGLGVLGISRQDFFMGWSNVTNPLPSTIGTSTIDTIYGAVGYSNQRKSFYAVGRLWAFYVNGTHLVFRSSTDGTSWTSATIVKSCDRGNKFSIWFDGTYVHYAYVSEVVAEPVLYRRGTPNPGGTITWADECTAVAGIASTSYYDPFVSVDSAGFPWIAYCWYSTNRYPNVTKSSTNDGTWTTAANFPYQLSGASGVWTQSIIPLTSQKMIAVCARSSTTFDAKRWDGSTWTSTSSIPSDYLMDYMSYSVVAYGDDAYMVYLKSDNNIRYTKYTYSSNSFSTATTVQAATSTSYPVLAIDLVNGKLYCFWASSNKVYYKSSIVGTGAWDANPIDFADESVEAITSNKIVTGFYRAYETRLGLMYETKSSSPYNVKFSFTTLNGDKVTLGTVSGYALSYKKSVPSSTPITGDAGTNQTTYLSIALFNENFFMGWSKEETSPTEIYDDDETFWTAYLGGTGSFAVTLSEELTTKVKGTSSLKAVVGAGTYAEIGWTHTYGSGQDWSAKEFFCFYFYGANNGKTWTIQIRCPDYSNRYTYTFVDNFSGWKRFVIPLKKFTATGSPSWANVLVLYFVYVPTATDTNYFDRTVVDVLSKNYVERGISPTAISQLSIEGTSGVTYICDPPSTPISGDAGSDQTCHDALIVMAQNFDFGWVSAGEYYNVMAQSPAPGQPLSFQGKMFEKYGTQADNGTTGDAGSSQECNVSIALLSENFFMGWMNDTSEALKPWILRQQSGSASSLSKLSGAFGRQGMIGASFYVSGLPSDVKFYVNETGTTNPTWIKVAGLTSVAKVELYNYSVLKITNTSTTGTVILTGASGTYTHFRIFLGSNNVWVYDTSQNEEPSTYGKVKAGKEYTLTKSSSYAIVSYKEGGTLKNASVPWGASGLSSFSLVEPDYDTNVSISEKTSDEKYGTTGTLRWSTKTTSGYLNISKLFAGLSRDLMLRIYERDSSGVKLRVLEGANVTATLDNGTLNSKLASFGWCNFTGITPGLTVSGSVYWNGLLVGSYSVDLQDDTTLEIVAWVYAANATFEGVEGSKELVLAVDNSTATQLNWKQADYLLSFYATANETENHVCKVNVSGVRSAGLGDPKYVRMGTTNYGPQSEYWIGTSGDLFGFYVPFASSQTVNISWKPEKEESTGGGTGGKSEPENLTNILTNVTSIFNATDALSKLQNVVNGIRDLVQNVTTVINSQAIGVYNAVAGSTGRSPIVYVPQPVPIFDGVLIGQGATVWQTKYVRTFEFLVHGDSLPHKEAIGRLTMDGSRRILYVSVKDKNVAIPYSYNFTSSQQAMLFSSTASRQVQNLTQAYLSIFDCEIDFNRTYVVYAEVSQVVNPMMAGFNIGIFTLAFGWLLAALAAFCVFVFAEARGFGMLESATLGAAALVLMALLLNLLSITLGIYDVPISVIGICGILVYVTAGAGKEATEEEK